MIWFKLDFRVCLFYISTKDIYENPKFPKFATTSKIKFRLCDFNNDAIQKLHSETFVLGMIPLNEFLF